MITEAYFIAYVGRAPKDDDLERCNCPKAGKLGHQSCGWDRVDELPRFMSTRNEDRRRMEGGMQ